MGKLSVEHSIAGSYQLDAMLHGWLPQRAWHRARLDMVDAVFPPLPGLRALDAAAGSGILTWRYPKASIISADLRTSACATIAEHTPAARTVGANVCALPFRSESFRQLYFLEAIEHLSPNDGRAAVRELRRVAARRGRCLITTPNYRSAWVATERALDALQLTPPMGDGQHIARYDRASLEELMASTGWTIARIGSFNLFAPLVGVLSKSAGRALTALETKYLASGGMLLYAVCDAAA